eukprot:CAMPEP_0203632994 /NCGR_PEP_ID=MMETSP0088-20131115/180_1 /ASSEMBLY_ACC=CAM_ASM_001087 /TAXON_ID=426623 /ORGANISM="Chaetoceros affinis, Strain CCMP159" /LENGTH=78 /DNA_ID=CAMNT_0050486189 /DNA_START=191 /DNA_END=427 /DNA_ORIENTATION=-
MKFAIAALLVGSAAAFAPISQPPAAFRVKTSLSAVPATGVDGKPAKSAEEDLELTREVIFNFLSDDASADEETADDEE